MTKKQFLRAISKFKDWKMNSLGAIRRSQGRCPISALKNHKASYYLSVASQLGISLRLAQCIAQTADFNTNSFRYNPVLRNELVKATHLEERESKRLQKSQ